MQLSFKRVAAWGGAVCLAAVLAVGAYAGVVIYTGNFNAVIVGELYRSAQPDARSIERDANRYGIKTIINLRGANPGKHWYDKEVAEANLLGIRHVDFSMSARRQLTQAQAVELIGLMDSAAKPILIHCESGADRTGLASALYLASIAKRGETASEAQLSLRFGHLSLPFVSSYAMDRTFEALEPWLGFHDS
ncbi:dual specificity protein phosphatase family protein [Labrys monachus]|uniref:Protein tyrosine/serine phosphatase n=1 Tax=Labrys monachus TaxID=217067 RepID=A0ABU0FDK3_9HYPH|nr:dual specificity protein phosphatase family protein [Labrys monachus]MDQ0392683.1 protein tyrosine/serine phosphatase [Labrys monachus]